MDEKSRKGIEYELADVLTAQPHEFTVGRKHYRLYPVTLAKMYLLKEYIAALGLDMVNIQVNPYLEALRVVEGKRRICCSILAIHTTPNTYRDLFCRQNIAERRNAFEKVNREDLASLLMIVLTSDTTAHLMEGLGLNEEHRRMKRASMAKKDTQGSLTFGGKTVFGSFIAPLKEMGYTDDEIIYERPYAFLRLLLADKITTMYLTGEELENLSVADGGKLIDGNSAESMAEVAKFAKQHGIEIKDT